MKPKVEIKDILEAPNLQELKDIFGVTEKETIVSYGNSIYAPNKQLTHDLLRHEMVHCERQRFNDDDAKRWWDLYMKDTQFRLQEELIAYKVQYQYCCNVYKDRNKQAKIRYALASELSSTRYGSIVTQQE